MTPKNLSSLKDIKVVEFTHMVMGPATGVILADLGADVVKIEPIDGDKTRNLKGSGAGYFPMYNRNKKSLCLDLKSEAGKKVALALIKDADVLIENFRSGAMEKLGFGEAEMRKINPGLIYCSLKGFLKGPYENRTALDEVAQMMGGLAYMTGLPDRPMRAGSSVIDITGAMFGVIGILSALHERNQTGRGRQVTSSLFETTAFMVGQHMAQQAVSGQEPPPMSIRRSAWSVYDIFKCRDDERVFIGVVSDGLWLRFCEEFGFDELGSDLDLRKNNDRLLQRDRIIGTVSDAFADIEKNELMARLEKAGIPFAPINKPADLFDDPHLLASNGLLEVTAGEGKTLLPTLPVEIDGQRANLYHDMPQPGEDSVSILKDAGFSETDIEQLLADKVINTSR